MFNEFAERWDEEQEYQARERLERKFGMEQELLRLYELGDSDHYDYIEDIYK